MAAVRSEQLFTMFPLDNSKAEESDHPSCGATTTVSIMYRVSSKEGSNNTGLALRVYMLEIAACSV